MKDKTYSGFLNGNVSLLALLLVFSACSHVVGQSSKTAGPLKGYGSASYSVTTGGQFMHDWLIAGPIEIPVSDRSEDAQRKKFDEDKPGAIAIDSKKKPGPIIIEGKSIEWQLNTSKADLIDLDNIYKKDYAYAYAISEIKSDSEQKIVLSIGSDDGVKVWLNGNLVHNNWIPRAVAADQDLVILPLVKGSNQLLIKVQDIEGGWGFMARILDKNGLSDKLVKTAAKGNLDETKILIERGADLNYKDKVGLTALNSAKISGREDIVKFLKERGAVDVPFPSPADLVDREYDQLKGKKAAGISLLVSRDGKILYEKGFGYANIDKGELITPETKFRIGSITKQFIGAAILKLQEEGKISVDDKLSKFIPDFPRGNEVTVHHLLTHTSGIHSYTGRNDFISRVTSPISEDDLITIIKSDPYDFSPGEQYRYNNSGYFLLGHIIRKVTGKFYGDYLKETFFIPLNMTNTGVHESTLKLTNEAIGYKKENDAYKADINWDMTWAGGAGSLYSTVGDLYKWNEGIFTGKVLKEESLKKGLTSVVLNNGQTPPDGKYGYGWAILNYRGQEEIAHGGGLHGFSTRIARFPKEKLTVVMLTNVIPTEVNLDPNSIAEFYLWDKMDKQNTYAESEAKEDVRPYEGRYDFRNGVVMVVTSENNNLFAQLTGQPRFPIFSSAPGEYFWKVVDARVKFVRDEKGVVTHGDFTQNGNNLTVPKLKEEVIVSIDPVLFDDYVGKYDLGNNVQVTVTKENGRFYAQGTNQPKHEIFPVSETNFMVRDLNAHLLFVKDKPGKATKFILDMAGQKQDAPRIE